MDLFILGTDLDELFVLDNYQSFLWADRYDEHGDFEIVTTVDNIALSFLEQDNYIRSSHSDHVMILERILIDTDVDDGNTVTVSGRSLESILSRRIIWGVKTIRGNLQNGVKELLQESIINPIIPARKIDNFIFEESLDPMITSLTIEAQFTGTNLYDVIKTLCGDKGIGFKVSLNKLKQFVFKLYAGKDRSYEQLENPYVIFSPEYENIINSRYIESKMNWKNVTLIGGEGEGPERRYAVLGESEGLNRRELFTDARDISSDLGDGEILTPEEYTTLLQYRGYEKLLENLDLLSFDGKVETNHMFRYGEDFFNGDIVQIENEYGHKTRSRIIEIIVSEDGNGLHVYPTFNAIF